MVRQARSRASAEVYSDIESVGFYRKIKRLLCVPYQFIHFEEFLVRRLFEIGYVPKRSYEQMAVVIGEVIQHRYTVFGPPQDKILVVVLRDFNIFA